MYVKDLLKKILYWLPLTKPSTIMCNKTLFCKYRNSIDFVALSVLIVLLCLLGNLITDIVNTIETESYTNIISFRRPLAN